MQSTQNDLVRAQQRRLEIEAIIAGYPKIDHHEIDEVLSYLKKEASAMDRATIASNEQIRSRYRAICHDHYLNRLSPHQIVVVAAFTAMIILTVTWLSFQF